MLEKPERSARMMSHMARIQTFPLPSYLHPLLVTGFLIGTVKRFC